MNKLVFGVGINDLDYRTQVYEYVTEDGGRRVRKPVFICKYYKAWANKRGLPNKQCLHAEIKAAIMLTKSGKAGKAKYLYVAAVSEAGNVLCAKPCVVCQMMLDESFPEIEVFWTKR